MRVGQRFSWFFDVLVALALMAVALAPATSAAPITSSGTISGVVTDNTGTAMAGVMVIAGSASGSGAATTAADGTYKTSGLPAGNYTVRFTPPTGSGFIPGYWNNAYDWASATPVAVVAGVDTAGISAQFEIGGTISGVVTDNTGTAIAGVMVYPISAAGSAPGAVTTAADGTYKTSGLPAGNYTVQFTPPAGSGFIAEYWNNTYNSTSATPVTAVVGVDTPAINAQLGFGGTISGVVTDNTGTPMAGVVVFAISDTRSFTGVATTAADGTYQTSGIPAGNHTVQFMPPAGSGFITEYWNNTYNSTSATPVTVVVGVDTPAISAQLEIGGTISGVVTDNTGTVMAGVWIYAKSTMGSISRAVRTAADGAYKTSGLPAGSYTVRFAPPTSSGLLNEYWNNAYNWASATPVTVVAGVDTAGLSAQLEVGGTISGVVTDNTGTVMAGVTVNANGSTSWRSATTAADGTYQISGLPAGNYTVQFAPPAGSGFIPESWNNAYGWGSSTPVAVVAGADTPGIDAQFEIGGTISGVVTDNNGTAMASVTVNAIGGIDWVATTAADGTYQIRALPTGNYTVRFTPPVGSGLLNEYWNNAYSSLAATPVAVVAGVDTPEINAQFEVGGTISGVVTDNTGTVMAGVWVSAGGSTGWGSATTAADGTYQIKALYPGNYAVQFTPPVGSGLLNEYWNSAYSVAAVAFVAVVAGIDTPGIDAQLEVGDTISGVVTDNTGAVMAGVRVDAGSTTGFGQGSATTAADGTYQISGLHPGNYAVQFYAPSGSGLLNEYWNNAYSWASATPVTVVAGTDTPGIDAQLDVGGTISGVVTGDADTAMAGVTVVASGTTGIGWGLATTAVDGTYQIGALPAGDYIVQFYNPFGSGLADRYWNNTYDWTSATPVTVVAGADTPGIDAEFEIDDTISGERTDETETDDTETDDTETDDSPERVGEVDAIHQYV